MAITARFGIEPIPPDANGDGSFSEGEYTLAARRVVLAGADNLSYSIAWNAFETSQGIYNTTTLGWLAAARSTAKLQVTIAVLDYVGNKNLPTYLVGNALDASAVTTAMRGVIDRLYTLLGAEGLDILALGNEVEAYLATHASEITPFANLIADAKTYATAKAGWSNVKVTASFKHSVRASVPTTYNAIRTACSYPAFTYYPINGDYTVQYTNAATIGASMFTDLLALPTAVGGTVILEQIFVIPGMGLLLLEAVAGPELVGEAYAAAVREGYLWHEFGDSMLLLP